MKINKSWYKSKTVLAGVWLATYFIAKFLGVEIPETEVFAILEQGTTFILSVMVIYGRFTANSKLK